MHDRISCEVFEKHNDQQTIDDAVTTIRRKGASRHKLLLNMGKLSPLIDVDAHDDASPSISEGDPEFKACVFVKAPQTASAQIRRCYRSIPLNERATREFAAALAGA